MIPGTIAATFAATLLNWMSLLFLAVGLLAHRPLLAGTGLLVLLTRGLVQLWRVHGGRNLSYRRRFVPDRVFPGQTVRFSAEVINDKPLPLPWLLIEDLVPPAARWHSGRITERTFLSRPRLVQGMAVGWFQRVIRHYTLQIGLRGVYSFGPAEATLSDPFGLDQQTLTLPGTDHLIVYPALIPLPDPPVPPARPDPGRPRRGSLTEDPARIRGVRPYQAGDSLRRVHWSATAHLGSLQVKELEPAVAEAACILLDVRLSISRAPGVPSPADPSEWAISAAASLYTRELARGRRVALYGNGHMAGRGPGPGPALPPTLHPAAGAAALEALARLNHGPVCSLEQLARRVTGRVAPGTALLVVTWAGGGDLRRCLRDCRRKGFPVQVFWIGDRPPAQWEGMRDDKIRITVLQPPPRAGSHAS
ncbi:MAG: DUF58 domain-containing protein [Firmicutes bacterium]|nr:DUF58 domain-containing protein [Bacillota bacterium]